MKPGDHLCTQRGTAVVLSVDGSRIRAKLVDTGEEIDIGNAPPPGQKRQPRHTPRNMPPKGAFTRFKATDFSTSIAGTEWRARGQLGGTVSNLLDADGLQMSSWSVSREPEVQWADIRHRSKAQAWEQGKLILALGDESMTCGFYIERQDNAHPALEDWVRWLQWLCRSGEQVLHDIMKDRQLRMSLWGHEHAQEFIDIREDGWIYGGNSAERIERGRLPAFLTSYKSSSWLNLLVYSDTPKDVVLERGEKVVGDIVDQFNALMPLYRALVVINPVVKP